MLYIIYTLGESAVVACFQQAGEFCTLSELNMNRQSDNFTKQTV